MKTNFTSILRPVIILSLVLSSIWACQQINPFEGVDLTVSANIYKSPMLIQFVDANNNSTTLPKDLTVSISGPNKDLVLDDLGGKDFKVAGNLLSLVLAEKANPTEDAPVEFTVSVKGTNYAATNYTIAITDTSSSTYTIPLTNLSALPDGVKSISKITSLTAGETIVIPASTNKPEVAKITIAPGTQVKDENGLVINSTSVSSTIIQYGTGTDDAFNSFPNDGIANTIKFKDGTTDGGSFIHAGFVDIEMTAAGKNVKSFSTPLNMTLSLHPNVVNPDTDEPVAVGEQVPVFSYNRNNDEWTEEGVAAITKDASGNLVANFKVPHLSTWTIAWPTKGKNCGTKTYKAKISSNVMFQTARYTAQISITKAESNRYKKTYSVNIKNGSVLIFKIKKAPKGYSTRIIIYDKESKIVGSSGTFSTCTNKTVTIPVKIPTPHPVSSNNTETADEEAVKVNLDFTAACTNKKVSIKPTVWVKLVDGSNTEQLINVVNGKATLAMKKNIKYQILATYAGKNYSGEVTIGNGTASITVSEGLTGSFPVDPVSGEVNATLIYPLNNCN
jgi:hypothetical protein